MSHPSSAEFRVRPSYDDVPRDAAPRDSRTSFTGLERAATPAPRTSALRAAVEFTRPHTIVGTTLAVTVFYVIAAAAHGKQNFAALLTTYVASFAINVYIVGLNQITDVEIDRINKPYLPIAAGSISRATATIVVALSAIVAFAVAPLGGPFLVATIAALFILGSAYSLPPLRLKRSPLFAAGTITLARAVIFNVGIFLTFSRAFGGGTHLPLHVLAFVGFMFGYVVVIAIMKDVPDIEGDRQHRIATLVLRVGAERTMLACRVILSALYVAMLAAAVARVPGVHAGALAIGHAAGLAAVWIRWSGVDVRSHDALYSYYMFIWKLFYFEFGVFAVACLLAPPMY